MKVGFAFSIAAGLAMSSTASWAEKHQITQKAKKFSKNELTIKIGDEVEFLNEDNTTHHLMYKLDGKSVSHRQKQGDVKGTAIVQKFEKEGEVEVRCAIHPKMKTKIKVTK